MRSKRTVKHFGKVRKRRISRRFTAFVSVVACIALVVSLVTSAFAQDEAFELADVQQTLEQAQTDTIIEGGTETGSAESDSSVSGVVDGEPDEKDMVDDTQANIAEPQIVDAAGNAPQAEELQNVAGEAALVEPLAMGMEILSVDDPQIKRPDADAGTEMTEGKPFALELSGYTSEIYLVLPAGLEYDPQQNLVENVENPNFGYDTQMRKLTVQPRTDGLNETLVLTPSVAGSYSLQFADAALSPLGNKLDLTVSEAADDPEDAYTATMKLADAEVFEGGTFTVEIKGLEGDAALVLPDGIAFDAALNAGSSCDYDDALRKLTIAPDANGDATLVLAAEAAGEYSLILKNENDKQIAQTLSFTVEDGFETQDAGDFSATFDGIDLEVSPSSFSAGYNSTYQLPRNLNVVESFNTTESVKTIEITLANGLGLDSAPGMVATNSAKNNWTFDASKLLTQHANVIDSGVWVQDATIDGRQPRSGKLIYTLKPSTTNANITVGVVADQLFMGYGTDQTLVDAVSVKTTQAGADVSSAKLDEYTITREGQFWMAGADRNRHVLGAGASYSLSTNINYRINGGAGPDWLHQGAVYKFSAPKEMGLTGANITGGTTSLTAADVSFSAVDTTSSATHDYITVTINRGAKLTSSAHFWFTGTVDAGATPDKNLIIALVEASITHWDGTVYTPPTEDVYKESPNFIASDNGLRVYNLRYVYVAKADDMLTLTNTTNTIYALEKDTPAAMRPLGTFNVRNDNAGSVDGRRAKIEFDTANTGNIGVTAVQLMVGKTGAATVATDIVVLTTTGRSIPINSVASQSTGAESPTASWYAFVNLIDQDQLNSGEYIKSIEYTMGDIPSGAHRRGDWLCDFYFRQPRHDGLLW
ncbi:MAG: adhesive domain-containing protein [Christensenellaceae bacterium]|jgi:hypothetical protein